MSNKPNDGGPAFARPGFTAEQTESQEGMSLRAWLAGMAMQGIMHHESMVRLVAFQEGRGPEKEIAVRAAAIADALIAELEMDKP